MTCSIQLDNWIQANYTPLKRIAREYTADNVDLMSYYYFYLKGKGWAKIDKMTQNEKMRFSRVWLRNQSRWNGIEFADMRVNNFSEENMDIDIESYEENENIDILVNAESTTDSIKLWLIDMTNEWGDSVDKLIKIKYHYHHSLDLPEQILFDLVFTEMLTTRQVAKKLNIPHTASYHMVKALEKRLQILCMKKLN